MGFALCVTVRQVFALSEADKEGSAGPGLNVDLSRFGYRGLSSENRFPNCGVVGKPTKVDPEKQSLNQPKRKKGLAATEVQRYMVDYAIAGPQLHFVEQGELRHGVFDLMASAFDDEGRALSRLASRTTADLKAPSYRDVMESGFRIRQEFDVPTNAAFLRLGIEDELTRNLGTVEIALPVPVLPEDSPLRAHVLPPIEPD